MSYSFWNDKSILIIGASSDLCTEMVPRFVDKMKNVGLHYNRNREPLNPYEHLGNVRLYRQDFFEDSDCKRIVDNYIEWSGKLDFLVIIIERKIK